MTPAFSHLLCLYPMCCAKYVSELLDCPIVSLFGCGMGSTVADMITKNITSELSATTSREWQLRESWDMGTDTSGKEGLPETSTPGLIPALRSNHPEKSSENPAACTTKPSLGHPLPETRGHPSPHAGRSLRRWPLRAAACAGEAVQRDASSQLSA